MASTVMAFRLNDKTVTQTDIAPRWISEAAMAAAVIEAKTRAEVVNKSEELTGVGDYSKYYLQAPKFQIKSIYNPLQWNARKETPNITKNPNIFLIAALLKELISFCNSRASISLSIFN